MMSEKQRVFTPQIVSLEAIVPEDNFYRQLNTKLDLSFLRDLVQHLYKPFGRPGIDPVVFFKLQWIMFFEDIRSERQLMDTVAMRIDHRWYIGYDLDTPVPDHSSLSRIRDRYGVEIFQRFFEKIVEQCIKAGLVWGQELYCDGTKVLGNASMDSLVPRVQPHLLAQFTQVDPADTDPLTTPDNRTHSRLLIDKYNGDRLSEQGPTPSYRRITDYMVSATDPDATPMKPAFTGYSRLGYHTHYVVDGGKSRIVLAALVTPASVMDNTPMLDLARWIRFRWQLRPPIAVGDTHYGSTYNIVGFENDGIRADTPPHDQGPRQRDKLYHHSQFTFDAENNCYICPQGEILSYKHSVNSSQIHRYRAKKRVCCQNGANAWDNEQDVVR